VTDHALRSIGTNEKAIMVQYPSDHIGTNQSIDGDDVLVELNGKYTLAITNDVIQLMMNGEDIEVAWHSDEKKVKKNNKHYCIDKELVKVILKEMRRNNTTELGEERTIEGYTRATATTKDGNRVIFYSPHIFKDGSGMTGLMFILRKSLPLEKQ
jgi:hypothetical protein